MPDRQSPHPDNEMIDRMQEDGAPSHQGSAGGNVQRTVGSRAELEHPEGDDTGLTPATGKDNPAMDEQKGSKAKAAIRSGNQG